MTNGGLFARALEAELEVIEPGIDKQVKLEFVKREAGRDEADVEPDSAGIADEFNDVRARERLPAGEVGL